MGSLSPQEEFPLRYFMYRNTDKIMNVTINNNSSVIIAMEAANQFSSTAAEKTEESLLPRAVVEESAAAVEESAAAVEESSDVSVVRASVLVVTGVMIHDIPIQ